MSRGSYQTNFPKRRNTLELKWHRKYKPQHSLQPREQCRWLQRHGVYANRAGTTVNILIRKLLKIKYLLRKFPKSLPKVFKRSMLPLHKFIIVFF